MKVLGAVFSLLLCCSGLHANQDSGWYLRGFGGINYLSVPTTDLVELKSKGGYALGASCGYKFSRSFCLDGELTYRDNDLDEIIVKTDQGNLSVPLDGYIRSCSLMGNIIFDIPLGWFVNPYLGAGLGFHSDYTKIALSKISDSQISEEATFKDNGLSYQFLLGICFPILKKADCRLEYRIIDDVVEVDSIRNQTLAITCQYEF